MCVKSVIFGLLGSVTVFAFADGVAAELTVSIMDVRGRPVPDAVVIATARLTGQSTSRQPAAAGATAMMDQVRKAFVPSILVVQTGTAVVFPNSDTIAHQVYSFSQAKRFELGLYRGHPHPPVVLDRSGLVVLGCNIHDNMVGYIYVTDSPYFGKSDEHGVSHLTALPPAEYELTIWSPRLPRESNAVRQRIVVSDTAAARAEFKLTQALRVSTESTSDARLRDY